MNFPRPYFSVAKTLRGSLFLLALAFGLARGFSADPIADDDVEKLSTLTVSESPLSAIRYQSPQAIETISGQRAAETINVLDTEDVVKYFPSIFLRKRNAGDTQPVMATRTWGVNSSARSLVYADGVLLTALIANNNTIGAPRWGLVAPAEIERVEMLYGPFSAAYPGNSMGAVMEIVTRMPKQFEAGISQTEAWQSFSLYGTKDTFRTDQTAINVGNRVGKFSFWVSGNFQNSYSQPLTFVTSGTFPAGTTGGYAAANKLGQAANVLGASGLLHTQMANAKVKLAYDFSPWLSAIYTYGYWRNDAKSHTDTYLVDVSGQPTYAGQSGFATGTYKLLQEHTAQSLTLRSDTKGNWDWEAAGSLYHIDHDKQRSAATASATGTTLGTAGKVALLDGTGWSTLDLKGIWRPSGPQSEHELSFGAHRDDYKLLNPTYNTSDWQAGGPYTSLSTEGDGKTRTQALWLQDVWKFAPGFKATLGARSEAWKAYEGYNVSGTTAVSQPTVSKSGFSPKASVAWTPDRDWTITASFGEAYRFPTAGELYQLVSTGTTFTSPNPNLKPEHVYSSELKFERTLGQGKARLSLFQEDVKHTLVSQYATLVPNSSALYQYVMNVDQVRARGVELVLSQNNVLIRGLELSGSVTYADDKILSNSGQGQVGSTIGKRMPYVPEWRFTTVATYRPSERWAFTAAGRYSGAQYSTVDNIDVNPNVYGGFATFFVADLHTHYQIDRHWAADAGIDNVLNRKYFLFHPFPQRTFSVSLKYGF